MQQTHTPGSCKCSVDIKNLGVRRGSQIILHDVNLSAHHGEILALIGRNGAGKTTLLKAIMNRIPHTGTVEFYNSKGECIQNPRIGYVPQHLSFDHSTPLTVADLFCANRSRMPVWLGHRKEQLRRAEQILQKVGLNLRLSKKLGSLSGGELQRVLLAFALEPMPDMLLLDEPVSAVDRPGTGLFYELVTSLRSEYHMPILLVSHDLGHVRKYASAAAYIDKTVVMRNAVDKVLNNPEVRGTFGLDEGGR